MWQIGVLMNKEEIWNKWSSDVHETLDAKKRIVSAQKADLTPILLDNDDCMAYFQGGHGRYETFLDYCPCGDFHRRKLPCKHIYRLAMELGLIEGNPINDPTRIKIPMVKDALGLSAALDIIEKCSEDAQILALDIFSNAVSGTYKNFKENSTEAQELLDSKIVHMVQDNDNSLKNDYFSNTSGNDFSNIVILEIEDNFSNVKKNIFRYLKRKYDPQKGYDENMDIVAYYPDDEITALLISRGFLKEIG